MTGELWFYLTTVLICTGYALLTQTYPRWKVYFSIGLLVFIIGGGMLVYFDAKESEEHRAKIEQMERMLDVAKKEAEKQESLLNDATERSRLLTEQLKKKTEELDNLLKDKPKIVGEIRNVRIFPWQRASASRTLTDDQTTATGILVSARIENQGAGSALASWELTIELPDNTIIKPQKWPIEKEVQIPCEDGPIRISKDEYLNPKMLQRTEVRSGVTLWMLKGVRLETTRTKNSVYTLTVRDNVGVTRALERYTLAALSRKCFGFDFSD